jgi:uncharacterized protein (DUF1778 family)
MATIDTLRDQRLHLRMPAADKAILEKAASHLQMNITSFVLAVALPEARKILSEAESVTLSRKDSERVMVYLDQPPAPTPTLRAAAGRLARRLRAAPRSDREAGA